MNSAEKSDFGAPFVQSKLSNRGFVLGFLYVQLNFNSIVMVNL